MSEPEKIFEMYPFTKADIEYLYKCVGNKTSRTIEVLEEAMQKGINPLDIPGIIHGIGLKTTKK